MPHADPDPGEVGVHQIAVVTAVVRPLALVEEMRGKDRCVWISTTAADVLAPVGCRIARAPQSVVGAAVRVVAALPGRREEPGIRPSHAIEIPESSLSGATLRPPGLEHEPDDVTQPPVRVQFMSPRSSARPPPSAAAAGAALPILTEPPNDWVGDGRLPFDAELVVVFLLMGVPMLLVALASIVTVTPGPIRNAFFGLKVSCLAFL